jgi:P27 family predicted phage terminase small subunit
VGSRGPAKMPTPLKLLHGEKRASRLNRESPQPRSKRPVMPADMSDDAKRVWRRILRDFGQAGVVTAVDADSFRAYCEAVARYQQAARTLEQTGPLVRGARSGELVKNPLHQIVRDNAALIRAFARELGFLPSAREGLHRGDSGDVDPLDQWLQGQTGA